MRIRRLLITSRTVCVCRPAPPRTVAVADEHRALVRRYVARLPLHDGLPPTPAGCGPW
ncbi:hypothetical protein V1J52_16725 [Streptomyces sp. TRM 70351]|uniref:hypothetical protein n=1 Tax=Streptomyces sp. TRM 70351 TaxID=3116552 RepID=UPI002E7C0DD5|nr:hypothetical protein [Streptomyces sp. TRM 70351]MEE1929811.1 hypothetical protein [Streptomyces sp. TRM 70351]